MHTNRHRKVLFWFVLLVIFIYGANQIFSKPQGEAASDLIIDEFVAVNGTGLTDENNDYSDWIEIYNRSNQPVNLSGWTLTDDPQQLEKWTFPNISLGSRQYLVVFASGKDRQSDQPGTELHTNFKLNRAGAFLGLYSGPNDPTLAWKGTVSPVNFSIMHGFYDQPFTVALTTDTLEAIIRYTTDGSAPDESHGAVYSEPLPVNRTTFIRAAAFKPGFLPSPVNTQTYIFLDNVLAQPANPPGFPDTWGTHVVDFLGYKRGSPVQADYEMDPDIVNDLRYGPTLKD
ncbi:MAG: lamin tail domain-containing protein, partial [Chloroflexi bacterium]|nr:lamin tail domain-containing protein [Chloroflexota bacterium]